MRCTALPENHNDLSPPLRHILKSQIKKIIEQQAKEEIHDRFHNESRALQDGILLESLEHQQTLEDKTSRLKMSSSSYTTDDMPGACPVNDLAHTFKSAKQIFFDCDNTLVDTEVVAAEAASMVIQKVLYDQGITIDFDNTALFTQHFGRTAGQMIVELQKEHNFTLSKEETATYMRLEEDYVISLIENYPVPCAGVKEMLQTLTDTKKYKLAIVSSSPIRRIRAALETADLAKFFKHDNVFSAKSSMPTPKSKPDPAIYNWAMVKMGVTPEECIAFEDSRSGARSAINAGIDCIAYVGVYTTEEWRDNVASILEDEGCKMVLKDYKDLNAYLE